MLTFSVDTSVCFRSITRKRDFTLLLLACIDTVKKRQAQAYILPHFKRTFQIGGLLQFSRILSFPDDLRPNDLLKSTETRLLGWCTNINPRAYNVL